MSKETPIPYKRFRTGLTYREVAAIMWSYSDDKGTWLPGSEKTVNVVQEDGTIKKNWKRRRLILGRWREIKLEMYEHYMRGFNQADQLDELDPVPF